MLKINNLLINKCNLFIPRVFGNNLGFDIHLPRYYCNIYHASNNFGSISDESSKNSQKILKKKKKLKSRMNNKELNDSSRNVINTWKNIKATNKKLSNTSKNLPNNLNNFYTENFGTLTRVTDIVDIDAKRQICDSKKRIVIKRKGSLNDQHISNPAYRTDELVEVTKSSDISPESDQFGTLSNIKDLGDVEEGNKTYADYAEEKHIEALCAPKYSLNHYKKKIRLLLKQKKLGEALNVLDDEMKSVLAKPDEFIYRMLIAECGKYGYTLKAFELYKSMKQKKFTVKLPIYTSLFNSCANCPPSQLSKEGINYTKFLHNELKEKQVILNNIVYHSMIKAYGRCGDIKTSFELVDEMIENCISVNQESFSFLLQSCVSNKQSGFRHALIVWRKMRILNITPDVFLYNLLLECIEKCDAGSPKHYSDLLEFEEDPSKHRKKLLLEGKEDTIYLSDKSLGANSFETSDNKDMKVLSDHLPDLLGLKATKGSIVAINKLDLAEDRLALCGGSAGFLQQMLKDSVKPNVKTFTKLLRSIPHDINNEKVFLSKMKESKLYPDTIFFNELLNKCCNNKDSDSAKEVLKLMTEYRIQPDIFTYGTLAKTIGTNTYGNKRIQECKDFLSELYQVDVRTTVEIFVPLFSRALKQHDYKFAVYLFEVVTKRNIQPNEHLIHKLEKFRVDARKELIQLERMESLTMKDRKKIYDIKVYLKSYLEFTKKTTIHIEGHPWEQFQFNKVND